MPPVSSRMPLRRFHHIHQRRTFLGLQRTPSPPPKTMALLVLQGLGIVLLADYAIASVTGEATTVRSVAQSAGYWQDAPPFKQTHEQKKVRSWPRCLTATSITTKALDDIAAVQSSNMAHSSMPALSVRPRSTVANRVSVILVFSPERAMVVEADAFKEDEEQRDELLDDLELISVRPHGLLELGHEAQQIYRTGVKQAHSCFLRRWSALEDGPAVVQDEARATSPRRDASSRQQWESVALRG
ncbi:hypothetical protein BST61_g8279 [Cercospora zeina]